MAIPSIGQIGFTQVYDEVHKTTSVPANYSLASLAEDAETNECIISGNIVDFNAPYAMNNFLGMRCVESGGFRFEINSGNFSIAFETGYTPDCIIFWGDGNVTEVATAGTYSHTYLGTALYEIRIQGSSLSGLNFSDTSLVNRAKIFDIKEWGKLDFDSTRPVFNGCGGLTVSATDIPDLTNAYRLAFQFLGCSSLTTIPNLELWDVSTVSVFGRMFFECTNWNQDISNWDVSNATDFSSFVAFTSFSTANYDALLLSWSQQSLQSNVLFGQLPCYSNTTAVVDARNVLTGTYNWTISDDGNCQVITAPSNVSISYNSSTSEMTLTFDDNSYAELQHRIERKTVGGSWTFIANYTTPNGLGSRSYLDNDLFPPDFYTYRVRSEGDVNSAFVESNTIKVT